MIIKQFSLEHDYPIAEAWWKAREWTPLSKDALSLFGKIVYNGEKPIIAGWLYPVLGSSLCWQGFPISNPDTTEEERDEAFDILIKELHTTAKTMGYSLIMTTTGIPAVANRLSKHSYKKADCNIDQYIGGL